MDFYRRMREVLLRVPEGMVVTYGQVALLCGAPANSRQVGYGFRMGRAGQVPAYRVVNARGVLSGAAAFSIPGEQQRLLRREGVTVETEEGEERVDLRRYGWRPSLDEAEELRALYEQLGI